MVDLAQKNLLHDKVRLVITLSGVAFAVILVLVQIGLFFGILDSATITIRNMPADLWITSRNTPNIDFAHTFSETYVQRVRSVPGVERADNLILLFAQVALPTGALEATLVYAMEDFEAWQFPWHVLEGNRRDLRRGDYVFIDDSAEKRFGSFQVGEYREYFGRRLKITGKTTEAKSFTTTPLSFMDLRLAQAIGGTTFSGKTSYIVVRLAPGANVNAVRNVIQARLPYHDVHTQAEWAKRSRDYWIINTGLGFNMFITVFLGCLVGIVIVAQTLYTSTMEHLREFGTVKAMGGSNAFIYRILAKQAVLSAIGGFALGALAAYAIRPWVAKGGLTLIIPFVLVVVVFFGTVILCLAASMISFRKVSTLDPALVFRS